MWNVRDFASDFRGLIEEYSDKVVHSREDSIEQCEMWRSDSEKMLERLLRTRVSKGYRLPGLARELSERVDGRWNLQFLKSEEGGEILRETLRAYKPYRDKRIEELERYLFDKLEDMTMKEWIENEDLVAKVLGSKKSVNIFLRDCKSFSYVPIDRHERRFIVRTGIFSHYLSPKVSDPDEKKHYETALHRFLEENLKGFEVSGYDLGESPGLVDKFIWLHCADRKSGGKEICSNPPECDSCPLSGSCLMGSKQAEQG